MGEVIPLPPVCGSCTAGEHVCADLIVRALDDVVACTCRRCWPEG